MTAVAPAAPTPVADRSEERGYWYGVWLELRHNKGAIVGGAIVAVLLVAALFAPLIAPHDPTIQFRDGLRPNGLPVGFSGRFLLGGDPLGRDEFSRLLYGARVSLAVAIFGNVIAAVFGVAVGGIAGISGVRLQALLMRLVDVILSFPVLLLALALLSVVHPSVITIIGLVGVSFGAYLARIVFNQAVSLREREFVLAARTAGVRTPAILVRHILPHVLPAVLVVVTLGIATAVQLEATLSYVGIGVQPPTASWGRMISDGQGYIGSAPRLIAFPGLAIVAATLGFSLLGDALRDVLDPSLERKNRFMGIVGVR